jgi:hypothetical protein
VHPLARQKLGNAAGLGSDTHSAWTSPTSPGIVALSDHKRTTPQIFRPGDGRRTHCANTTPSSDGQDGRLSAQCDSQPEDLLRRDDVDTQCNSASGQTPAPGGVGKSPSRTLRIGTA